MRIQIKIRLTAVVLGALCFGKFTTTDLPAQQRDSPLRGTSAQRGALFDTIIARTERREAFSPVKEARLGLNVLNDMRALRNDVVNAGSDADFIYALLRLSNARRDVHLTLDLAADTIDFVPVPAARAPVTVLADFSDLTTPSFFISAVDSARASGLPRIPTPGDVIVAVNGRSVNDYVTAIRPYTRYSSVHGMLWELAKGVPVRTSNVHPSLYRETLDLELTNAQGERYSVSLPYRVSNSIPAVPSGTSLYPGMTIALRKNSFHLLLPSDSQQFVLIRWLTFGSSIIQDVADLMQFAEQRGILDHPLILDVTASGGGARGAFAIQRFVSKPFKTTFGNLRVSDAAAGFVDTWLTRPRVANPPDVFGLNESGEWLRDWLNTDAKAAIRAGEKFTSPVPFKLAHLPKNSDGILQPAPVHFRGPVAVLSGPSGGSHLDQFMAMMVDNDLAVTIGMPAGGYSNTWEFAEELTLPGTNHEVVEWMWTIGQTFRPNGEILEGNPAMPKIPLPLTRVNFRNYNQLLLERALRELSVRGG